MLAREYCDAAGIKLKPIILSHHMLYGLKAGQHTPTLTLTLTLTTTLTPTLHSTPYTLLPTPTPTPNPDQAGQQKMSKSDADSAIFMEDSAEDVRRKLEQAHCPTQEADEGESKVPEEEHHPDPDH